MKRSSADSPWVTWGLYVFAVTLILSPMVDLVTTVWPVRPTDMGWRYGTLGLAAGYVQTPLLGAILAMGVSYWQERAGALRLWSVLCLVGTVILLISMVTFGLDVVSMRSVRPPDAQSGILAGGLFQEAKYAGACLVSAFLGIGGRQVAAAMPRATAATGSPGSLRGD